MRRAILCGLVAIVMVGTGSVPLVAQENSQTTVASTLANYRIRFVFDELQGDRVVNSRSYEMLAQVGQLNKLRAGSRVPVRVPGPGATPAQFQYLDVGMNIDCRVQERNGAVLLSVLADASNFSLPEAEKTSLATGQPIVQQLKSEVETVVSPGKPTIISSMDDPSGKRRFQLEVTAMKVK